MPPGYPPRRVLTATRTNAATPPITNPTMESAGWRTTSIATTPASVTANHRQTAAVSSSTRFTESIIAPRRVRTRTKRKRRTAGRPGVVIVVVGVVAAGARLHLITVVPLCGSVEGSGAGSRGPGQLYEVISRTHSVPDRV